MNHYIDTRGITAAQSWYMIQEGIANAGEDRIITVTDNLETARYIKRMAEQSGLETRLEDMGGEYYLHFTSGTRLQEPERKPAPKNAVVIITGVTLGRGEDALGKALLKGYLYHLKYVKPLPKCVIFMNEGVKLTTEGSEVLGDLKLLSDSGVEILSSSTCLEFYGRMNGLQIGGVIGMRQITERMHRGENTLVL